MVVWGEGVGGATPRMIPWARQERSLLTGEGAFLWVQNDAVSSVSLRLLSRGTHLTASDPECVAEGATLLTSTLREVHLVTFWW